MSDTALLSQLRSLGDEGFPVCWRAADALEQQAAQIEALRADAERYRWLRAKGPELAPIWFFVTADLDAAIDAALRQEQPT